ncbi:MAG: HAD family hydrolase [Bacteroidota bacterium]|jgi:HAD superfamily hydrolase (TIGR01490 family)
MRTLRAAVFDLDGTIIAKDMFGMWIREHLQTSPLGLVRGLMRPADSPTPGPRSFRDGMKCRIAAGCMRVWQASEDCRNVRDRLVAKVLAELVAKGAREEIEKHRRERRLLVLATGSLDFYAEPLARALGFDEVIATRSDPEAGPRNRGIIGPNVRGAVKRDLTARLLKTHGLDLARDAVAYSDSASDFPLLDAAAQGVLVNPSSRTARAARQKPYTIVHWH